MFSEKKKKIFVFVEKESTLFVVLIQNSLSLERTSSALRQTTISIQRCLSEKLALISDTKLVITNNVPGMKEEENISSETLEVRLSGKGVLTTLLQLLSKRLEKLDLISVMQELQRVTESRGMSFLTDIFLTVEMRETLSCVPRLQKTKQIL